MENYRQILCASDFSPAATAALRRAAMLAKASAAQLTLLHVLTHFPEDRPSDDPVGENEDAETAYRNRALERLREQARSAGVKAELEVTVSRHSAVRAILDYLDEHPAELLVVGESGGHGAIATLGSTAAALSARARHDVLVVRGEG